MFFAIITILTGLFREFSCFTFLLLVHELGHCLCALHYGWQIDCISFYPYGGSSKFSEKINRPIKEEFLILLAGPIAQVCFYLLCTILPLREQTQALLRTYHYAILFFNLLPIYPLDGGKLVNLFLSKHYPYLKSLTITLLLSYLLLLGIVCIQLKECFSLNVLLVGLLLFTKIKEEWKKRNFYYQRFLLERYLYPYHFKTIKTIENPKEMMRDKRHLFKKQNHYYTEKTILLKTFKRNDH